MDILKPKIVIIGNRCYRKNPKKFDVSKQFEQEEEFIIPKVESNFEQEDEPSCVLSRKL